ncbi:MAG: polysaccharide deacetylase family protein [Labilithrix sp.]|nr:polysaccharide deacetylase family protein [Labilithrix sp.]MBX3221451.1 polysaccharide deacetylase family protein [Labilithrix sp.]
MVARRLLALLLVATSACVATAGCAVDGDGIGEGDDDDNVVVGDGMSPDDELVAERQLNGSELPNKTISLTFDDGPGRRTGELADYLAEKGVKGAFFINGSKVAGRQGAIDKIVGRGHLLANHTHNHKQLTSLSAASVVKEIADTDAIIAQAQPQGPWVVRAPFGAWNANVARAINASSMKKYVGSVFWDQGGALTTTAAADWDCWGKGVSVQRCGDLYLNEIRTKKRGVVLFHDIHDKTVDMIKQIVPTLIAEGYTFAALEDVPSVKRAIAGASTPARDEQCQSATLGRPVDENVCVQSRSTQRWSRCVDGEWIASTGPTDTKCSQRFPL